jgi:O-antigen ligase
VIGVVRTFLNRHSAALAILAIPIAACIARWLGPDHRRTKIVTVLFYLVVGLLIMISDSETAKLGYVVSLTVFVIAWFSLRSVRYLLAASWCVACLASPLLVMIAFPKEFGWQRHLPPSAYDRAEIWRYTTSKISLSPIIGIGANQTRYHADSRIEPDARAILARDARPHDGFVPVPRLSVHAHNIFIQTWFELGAIGAALLAVFGICVLQACSRLSDRVQPFGLGAFASAFLVASTGYGMWQIWLVASVMLSVSLVSVVVANSRGSEVPHRAGAKGGTS